MAGKGKKTDDFIEDIEDIEDIEETVKKIYDEDDSDKKKDKNKKKRRRRRKKSGAGKKILLSMGVVIVLLAAAYFGIAMYFNSHFMFDTKINGVDFSLKEVSEVEDYLKKQVADYTLTLEESDGSREVIKGADIDIEFTSGERLKQLAEGQQKLLWIKSLWEPTEIEAKVGVKYNADKLNAVIDQLKCMDEKKQTASKNAYPAFKDGKFEIVPEVI